ncbi:MAG: GDP-mannose 4,6-dehydratase [Elusimicrobiota bacterium]|nr:GDP-mannose 4,6-dehydratase [Elusimicrobiota bacterium]
MKTLITGIAGFSGIHLAEYLQSPDRHSDNIELYGIDIVKDVSKDAQPILDKAKVLACDLLDREETKNIVQEIKPDKIFHLAGLTFDANSQQSPEKFYSANVFGTISLLESVKQLGINPLIHIACSSAEYGLILENENPVTETNHFRPISPYGISKLAQDMVGYQYYKNHGLRIIRTRAFNITGPGEKENFVCSSFARQIALIEKGKQEPTIYVGNLDSKRDFLDIRDVVKAYWLAVDKGISGEVYNLCSGKAYSIREMLDILLQMTKEDITVKQDPERMRLSDIPLQVGSFQKFHKQTGWEPVISLQEALKDLLNYWRGKVQ